MKRLILPLLIFTLGVSLSLYNIQNFPKMVGDEGIYVSQAYWLMHKGTLGPYTYWYDHFPLGWAQIGLWQLVAGANTFFESSALSARLFLGVALGGTTTLVYLLTKLLSKSNLAAVVAALFFVTSALTQTFGRMVLLDNLAVFWLLTSLYLLIKSPAHLSHTLLSSITICLAILTKESLLFMLPPYFLLLFHLSHNSSFRNYTRLTTTLTIIFLLSFFPLLALLKGELFPSINQVSLYEAILFQLKRGSQLAFYIPESHFRTMLSVWLSIDPILITAGFFSSLLLLIQQVKLIKFFSFFSLFFFLFLIRGGQIYDFYLIPLLPFLAINTALLLNLLRKRIANPVPLFLFATSTLVYVLSSTTYPWTSLATKTQLESYKETVNKLDSNSRLISNNYFHLDAYLSGHSLDWYSKVESDPAVTPSYLNNSQNIFILADETIMRELGNGDLPFLNSLRTKSSIVETFGRELGPGELETVKPYTNDFLTLYQISKGSNNTPRIILVPNHIDSSNINSLIAKNPQAILITNAHFSSTEDLQTKLKVIKANLPNTIILVSQDGEGNNTIPWINTNSRNFFKSQEEATNSTLQKMQALSSLGFTGAITATSSNQDGYLHAILSATTPAIIPFILYTGEFPTLATNLIVKDEAALKEVQQSSYNGIIYLLTEE